MLNPALWFCPRTPQNLVAWADSPPIHNFAIATIPSPLSFQIHRRDCLTTDRLPRNSTTHSGFNSCQEPNCWKLLLPSCRSITVSPVRSTRIIFNKAVAEHLRPYAPSLYVYASGNIFLELISFFGGSRNTQSAPHTRIATQDFYHHHQHEFISTRNIGRSCRAEEEHWEVYEETGYRFEEREFEQDI